MAHANFSIVRKEAQSLLDLVGSMDEIEFLILFVISSDADLYLFLGPVIEQAHIGGFNFSHSSAQVILFNVYHYYSISLLSMIIIIHLLCT